MRSRWLGGRGSRRWGRSAWGFMSTQLEDWWDTRSDPAWTLREGGHPGEPGTAWTEGVPKLDVYKERFELRFPGGSRTARAGITLEQKGQQKKRLEVRKKGRKVLSGPGAKWGGGAAKKKEK